MDTQTECTPQGGRTGDRRRETDGAGRETEDERRDVFSLQSYCSLPLLMWATLLNSYFKKT